MFTMHVLASVAGSCSDQQVRMEHYHGNSDTMERA